MGRRKRGREEVHLPADGWSEVPLDAAAAEDDDAFALFDLDPEDFGGPGEPLTGEVPTAELAVDPVEQEAEGPLTAELFDPLDYGEPAARRRSWRQVGVAVAALAAAVVVAGGLLATSPGDERPVTVDVPSTQAVAERPASDAAEAVVVAAAGALENSEAAARQERAARAAKQRAERRRRARARARAKAREVKSAAPVAAQRVQPARPVAAPAPVVRTPAPAPSSSLAAAEFAP